MGWTKRQFVEQAFEEIGYASFSYDLQPEQLQSALRRLDSMMASWNGKGIRLGYPIPSFPQDSELNDQTNVPDSANEAIYTNLAVRLAPTIGKMVSTETKSAAKSSYNVLVNRSATPIEMQLPGNVPAGAGNKTWRNDNPFLNDPADNISAGNDDLLDFN